MPELLPPTTTLHAAWLEAHAEWGPGQHEDGFGLSPTDDVHSPSGFAAWVTRLTTSDTCLYRWIVDDGRVLGGIALRWGDNDYIRWAGHLGYGIRPSARRRGLATWAVTEMLAEARSRGATNLTAVCAPDNNASANVLIRAGAIFDKTAQTPHGPSHRYHFPTP